MIKTKQAKEGLAKGEKIVLGLHLFCKKIVQNLLKEYKSATVFPLHEWKVYRKKSRNMIKVIEKDENYLEDLIIDCLSESSQTKIKERKQLLDQSKDDFQKFKILVQELLTEFLNNKLTMLNPDNKNVLVTICYILNGLDILKNVEKWESTGL